MPAATAHADGALHAFGRVVRTGVFPIGVHVDEVRAAGRGPGQPPLRHPAARQSAGAADPQRGSAGLLQGPAPALRRVRALPGGLSAVARQRDLHADRAPVARRHPDLPRDPPRAGRRGRPHQRPLRRGGLDAAALPQPRLLPQRADAALRRSAGRAGDAAARRHEPGGQGICRRAGPGGSRACWCCRSSPARRNELDCRADRQPVRPDGHRRARWTAPWRCGSRNAANATPPCWR